MKTCHWVCHPVGLLNIMKICHASVSLMSFCTQMKSRLQRWGNKRAIIACASPLHKWVRDGDQDVRLECIRNLDLPPSTSLPSGEEATVEQLVAQCHSGLVKFLLEFSSGKVLPGELNKKKAEITARQKPYSVYAGKETDAFKNVPPPWFAVTLATLYPFLAEDKSLWPERLRNNFAYPVTSLWPVKVVKRFVHFINTVVDKHSCMFKNYENAGGEYYKNEETDSDEEASVEVEDDSIDCDNVF